MVVITLTYSLPRTQANQPELQPHAGSLGPPYIRGACELGCTARGLSAGWRRNTACNIAALLQLGPDWTAQAVDIVAGHVHGSMDMLTTCCATSHASKIVLCGSVSQRPVLAHVTLDASQDQGLRVEAIKEGNLLLALLQALVLGDRQPKQLLSPGVGVPLALAHLHPHNVSETGLLTSPSSCALGFPWSLGAATCLGNACFARHCMAETGQQAAEHKREFLLS